MCLYNTLSVSNGVDNKKIEKEQDSRNFSRSRIVLILIINALCILILFIYFLSALSLTIDELHFTQHQF